MLNSLFMNSPVWLQNAAIGLYGLRVKSLRYGGDFQSRLHQLMNSDGLSAERLRQIQISRLREITRHAVDGTEHYSRVLTERSRALDLITPETLRNYFPVLSKSTVKESPERFRNKLVRGDRVINTSGSTGSPMVVTCSRESIRENYAFFARFLMWHGVSPSEESATFAGRLFIKPSDRSPVVSRRNWALRDTLLSSYHMGEEALAQYSTVLQKRQPAFIDAYPSSIYCVAVYLKENPPKTPVRPRVIVTSSETLLPRQRQLVEEVFSCPVRDQYGSAEMVVFAAQCSHGSYHVAPEYGIVEVLDAQGNPVREGEMGEICVTGFINPAMPLIRYKIGDLARVSQSTCACGRHSQILEGIEGRVDDVIITPSGRHIGRMDPAFKGVEGVKESQIVQASQERLVAYVVIDGSGRFNPGLLRSNLIQRVGDDMIVDIQVVPGIEKEANGKFRSVKNLMKR